MVGAAEQPLAGHKDVATSYIWNHVDVIQATLSHGRGPIWSRGFGLIPSL